MRDGDSCQRQSVNKLDGDCDTESCNDFHRWVKSDNTENYRGRICSNTLHGEGIYSRIKDGESYIYDGSFYANNFEGYARVIAEDSSYFEGLFKTNKRFGPGVLTYKDGSQDVGIWLGFNLVRLSRFVQPQRVPCLGCSDVGKAKVLKYRQVVTVQPEPSRKKACDILTAITNKYKARLFSSSSDNLILDSLSPDKLFDNNVMNRNSLFFDKKAFDEIYFGDIENYIGMVSEEASTQMQSPLDGPGLHPPCEENKKYSDLESLLEGSEGTNNEYEWNLITQRNNIQQQLVKKNSNQKACSQYPPMKSMNLTNVLAWNNTEEIIELLQHTFLHRNREYLVSFDVEALLTAKCSNFGEMGEYELACTHFLINCSNGDISSIKKYLMRVNPDVSDAKGNTGIMFAAARDKIRTIEHLTEIGANLDYGNDEGLTPLSMTLLRYLALLHGITNWEKAFLLDPTDTYIPDENTIWRERTSIVSLISDSNNLNKKSKTRNLEIDNSYKITKHTDVIYAIPEMLQQPDDSGQDYIQYDYNYNPKSQQEFIFKTDFPSKSKEIVRYRNVSTNAVFNTICTLLQCGADPNLATVPVPAMILGLYICDAIIYQKLLDHGANSNIEYGNNKLTPLHILTTLPINEHRPIFCQLLLDYGANPDLRCSSTHWPEQKSKLTGNVDELIVDKGKTPLHILAMREDFAPEDTDNLNKIVQSLTTHNPLSMTYLGHTPLSLSILKGNVDLVEIFLKHGHDPNLTLGYNLGTATTIYVLKRYSNLLPPLNICKRILDLLLHHGCNPLKQIGQYRNICEFILNEKVKGKNSKFMYVIKYWKKLIQTELSKYYKTKALICILQSITDLDDNYIKQLASFLTPNEALFRVHFLVTKKLLSSRRIIEKCFDFIIKNGSVKNKESVSIMMSTLEHYKSDSYFGFDQNEDDYVVCFSCGLKTNRVLLVCPKCRLVYFCSQECNKADASGQSGHPCRVLFYTNELITYKKMMVSGIPYFINCIGGINELLITCMEKIELLEIMDGKLNHNSLSQREDSVNNFRNFKKIKDKMKNINFFDNNKKLKVNEGMIKSNITNVNSGFLTTHSNPIANFQKDKINFLYESNSDKPNKTQRHMKLHEHDTKLNKISMRKELPTTYEKKTSHKSHLITYFIKNNTNLSNEIKGYGDTKPVNVVHGMPRQDIHFVNQIGSHSAAFDLCGLCKPYVCFSGGQLYYKFPASENNACLGSTYTNT